MKLTHIRNVEDVIDSKGRWIRTYCKEPYTCYHTRASVVWGGIWDRCRDGKGELGFVDFQELAEWCQSQYGYWKTDSKGRYWSLDKDFKVEGNRIYSPNTCIFVPTRINTLFSYSKVRKSQLPVGVYFNKISNRYGACIEDGRGNQKHLGLFEDPLEAHQSWQQAKISVIQDYILHDSEVFEHKLLKEALERKIHKIQREYENKHITK